MQPNHAEMAMLTRGHTSKSAKIRRLAAAGYQRADIARFLGIKYQHVRKVLVDEETRLAKQAGQISAAAPKRAMLNPTRVRIGPDGRVVVPAAFREALGVKEGDPLIASVEDGELRLLTIPAAVRKAQALVRRFVPEGVSLVDELLEDRRQEVEQEE